MDPLSQGVLGAVGAQSFARREQMKAATIAGVLGGMAPDLDVLIRSSEDPLLFLEFHRHFTHALAFIPVGGMLVGALLWLLFLRRSARFQDVVLFATLGWATHGLLDACTSYGTQLLWPFSNLRIAWNNVGIIDPLPTLAWLMGMIFALRLKKKTMARAALTLGIAYLVFGVAQRERAERVQTQLIAERGHTAARAEVKPTVLQLFVWRSIYESEGMFYVDAIRVGFGSTRVYRGESAPKFTLSAMAEQPPPDSTLARDLARFDWFSDGWLALHGEAIGDARYALLPHEIEPLWGITYDAKAPDRHVKYETFRDASPGAWRVLWSMIQGRELVP